jgi:demethylmenaquinone methyltransferase/2-methoxy-6-polyprenyl-1,4-benzoquinol methylase
MNTETLHEYYAARASEYDGVYTKPERQQDLRVIEQWLPSVFGARSLLEVACGTGYWTQFLVGTARELVAVDASVEVLRIARGKVESAITSFVLGDAYHLPVASHRFEAAFAGFWFSHVPRARVRGFLRELHRALVPGAKVVLLDNRFVPGSSTPISEQDAEGNTYQVRPLRDGSTHRVLKNFPSESALREAVAESARDVLFHEWQHFWALEYSVAAP